MTSVREALTLTFKNTTPAQRRAIWAALKELLKKHEDDLQK